MVYQDLGIARFESPFCRVYLSSSILLCGLSSAVLTDLQSTAIEDVMSLFRFHVVEGSKFEGFFRQNDAAKKATVFAVPH